MPSKFIAVCFEFNEVQEHPDEPPSLELEGMWRDTDMAPHEIDALGESVAQSDYWQVERWLDIQTLLGDSETGWIKFYD